MGNGWVRVVVTWARGSGLLLVLASLALVVGILVPALVGGAVGTRTPRGHASLAAQTAEQTRSSTSVGSAATSGDLHRANLPIAPDPDLGVAGKSLVNGSGTPLRLLGVDATGTEDACIEDKGYSWGPLTVAEANVIATWHANVVRVPLNEDCWLGINGAPASYSGAAYQAEIASWVSDLNAAGIAAILDLHWSAPGGITAITQWPMPDETHSVTFWAQVASTFHADPLVMFDLFNEPHLGGVNPHASDWACWLDGCASTARDCPSTPLLACTEVTYQVAGMQQLVDTVRNAGADQPIMIGGLAWAATLCGSVTSGSVSTTCAWLNYEPTDPLHQLVASFHNYFDKSKCDNLTCWNATIARLAAKVPVVTGELGENNCSTTFIKQYMQWADLHTVSYLVWAWQANTYGSSCGPGKLLSTWNGVPSTTNPVGPLLYNHLGQLQPPKA